MQAKAMTPHGRALLDYHRGVAGATLVIRRDDGDAGELPAKVFFEPPAADSLEWLALDLCRGEILDVGAGAGRHSLMLQERGLTVQAIDIAPEAVEVTRERGVRRVECADVFEYHGGPFDTLLMLCHGIGLVQDLAGLSRFLAKAHDLVKPDGQILLDSLDVRCTTNPEHLDYQARIQREGRYYGKVRISMEYKGEVGPMSGWLHVDPSNLANRAQSEGWACEVLQQEDGGDYVARLVQCDPPHS